MVLYQKLTFKFHADLQTFLKTAKRATFPLSFVNVTSSLRNARIDLLILNGPLEKSFAGFAREKSIVVAAHFIAANRT